MPIDVCVGDYCWDGKRVCGHFDNEGGHGRCDLGMDVDSNKIGYYPKPKECLELKMVEDVPKEFMDGRFPFGATNEEAG